MRVAILQSNYLPWKGYFYLIQCVDVFVFYDVVQYTKNDWRNRNKICGPNGVHWLTIPISKNAVKKKIEEVFLPSGCWKDSHIKSLRQAYSKAPFFGVIEDRVDQWYLGDNILRLSTLTIRLSIIIRCSSGPYSS